MIYLSLNSYVDEHIPFIIPFDQIQRMKLLNHHFCIYSKIIDASLDVGFNYLKNVASHP